MHHTVEILIPSHEQIPRPYEDGDARRDEYLGPDLLIYSRIEEGLEVVDESVRGTMLDPLLVGVDSSAILSGSLAVSLGDRGRGVHGRTHAELGGAVGGGRGGDGDGRC